LQARIDLSEAALSELWEIGASVPISSTLAYQTMLSYKQSVISLLKHKLILVRAGKSTDRVNNRIQEMFLGLYEPKAQELGLHVCGQGTGNQ
jgi:hypothetical protein